MTEAAQNHSQGSPSAIEVSALRGSLVCFESVTSLLEYKNIAVQKMSSNSSREASEVQIASTERRGRSLTRKRFMISTNYPCHFLSPLP